MSGTTSWERRIKLGNIENYQTNPNRFPPPAILDRMRNGMIDKGVKRMIAHEQTIAAAIMADNVFCFEIKPGEYMAVIHSGLICSPQQPSGKNELVADMMCLTGECIQHLLNNIPGNFNAKIVFMVKEVAMQWGASLLDGDPLDAMWNVAYTWAAPFEIETEMPIADIVNKYLKQRWASLMSLSMETIDKFTNDFNGPQKELSGAINHFIDNMAEEEVVKMIYDDRIKIDQHPNVKGCYRILASKKRIDLTDVHQYIVLANQSKDVVQSGYHKDILVNTIFVENNADYMGGWYYFKKTD